MDPLVRFLLSPAPYVQKHYLLNSITESQATNICEIVINILYKVIKISRFYTEKLKENKEFWLKLIRCPSSERVKFVSENPHKILYLLKACKGSLEKYGISKNDPHTH